ncbi:MAG: metallophosphoesterase [Sphaerochaetaceae bacterium]|nr:metallophosphoesterase [Sphaerochaetaceae bacterium]
MKILCISDTIDPLIYSNNIKERYGDVDLVLSSGDLSLEYYEYILSALNKPLMFVDGNHIKPAPIKSPKDCPTPSYFGDRLDDKVLVDKKTGLIIAGLGGSMRYNLGTGQYTEAAMKRRINALAPRLLLNKIKYGRYLDILVTHTSPRGIHDDVDLCHTGFECFNAFLDKYQPRYMLHGHMHLIDSNHRPVTQVGSTKVINVYKSYVLEIS